MEYTDDGCLNLVIQTYYQDTSLSTNKNDKNYYLNWLENDMLFVINNNRSLHDGVPFKLIKYCPAILDSIMNDVYPDDIVEHIKFLWEVMDKFQKKTMLRGYLISKSSAL